MCQKIFIKVCHGLNSEKWWYMSQVETFTLQHGAFQLIKVEKGQNFGEKAYLRVNVICLRASYDLSLRKPKLGSRWQALSIPGTKERAPSNIHRGANIIYRFQGRSIFSVYCGM